MAGDKGVKSPKITKSKKAKKVKDPNAPKVRTREGARPARLLRIKAWSVLTVTIAISSGCMEHELDICGDRHRRIRGMLMTECCVSAEAQVGLLFLHGRCSC